MLVLDDVFAELDVARRDGLAGMIEGAEQVLITAAVAEDVPAALRGVQFTIGDGVIRRVTIGDDGAHVTPE